MKYIARPVVVEAFQIVSTGPVFKADPPLPLRVATDDGKSRVASSEMQARYIPQVGDYWVIQQDGYEYLNPQDVFERKYSPAHRSGHSTGGQ